MISIEIYVFKNICLHLEVFVSNLEIYVLSLNLTYTVNYFLICQVEISAFHKA